MAVSEFTRRSGVVSMRGVGDVLKVVEDKTPVEESVAVDNDVVVGVDEEILAGVVIQVAIGEHRGPGADVVLVELKVGLVFALVGNVLDVGPVVPVRGVDAVETRGVLLHLLLGVVLAWVVSLGEELGNHEVLEELGPGALVE